MNNISELLDKVILIAKNAAQEVMVIYTAGCSHELKNDNSPLTIADTKSHDIIVNGLAEFNYAVISEEDQECNPAQHQLFWLVDPLDGTKEFIKKLDEFTINIALIKDNRPILGVVAVPAKNTIYYAAAGLGAYKLTNGIKQQMFCSKTVVPEQAAIAVSRSHLSEKEYVFIHENKIVKVIPVGSALKYCYLADGVVDLAVRYTPLMSWDIAASDIIVSESGGFMTDLRYNPIRYCAGNSSQLIDCGLLITNSFLKLNYI